MKFSIKIKCIFFKDNRYSFKNKFRGNGRAMELLLLSSQCLMAVSPRSCGMFVYKFTRSNDMRMEFSSISLGMCCRKSRSSGIKIGLCSLCGFRIKSTKLLSRCVSDDGPATMGRIFKPSGASSLM